MKAGRQTVCRDTKEGRQADRQAGSLQRQEGRLAVCRDRKAGRQLTETHRKADRQTHRKEGRQTDRRREGGRERRRVRGRVASLPTTLMKRE